MLKDFSKISKNINNIKTSKKNRNKLGEVGTPYQLRQDMINSLPVSFWKKPRLVLEPCCGKGGFLIDVIDKFMKYLNIKEGKYKYIVENLIFFADINKKNVNFCRKLLGEYNLNYYVGDSLKKDYSGFDLVIGNPPYQETGLKETGQTIYQKFIKISLEKWIKSGGYLLFVTPAAWRKPVTDRSPNAGLYKLMTQDNWLKYLEIHNPKDARLLFNASTRYDWYLIKKSSPRITTIQDELGKISKINLHYWPWIPNSSYKIIKKILAKKGDKTVDILFTNEFDSDRKHMSKVKTQKYKYVCVHSTPKSGIKYFYTDRKFTKKPKVIFGDAGIGSALVNKKGKYCLTEHAMGIVDKAENLDKILAFLKSEKMEEIWRACLWSNFMIDWKMFSYFKKNFYKLV